MTAMTLEAARAQRTTLMNSGFDTKAIRIRTRSWDTDGTYFGIDVSVPNPTGGTAQKRSLYSSDDVARFINEQIPQDILPYDKANRAGATIYKFKYAGSYAIAPDGSTWFSLADLKATKGIISINGKRFRAGQQQFVPFVS